MIKSPLVPARGCYEFGRFRLEPRERSLFRDGAPVQIQPKLFETLLALVTSGGQLISKEELTRRVWDDAIVEEGSLTRNIYLLRKLLGEDVIETVPKAGYRFNVPVQHRPGIASLAVLPFVDLGPDNSEYLADGITEELIDAFAQLPDLKVVARTSVFQFKGCARDIREIGSELGVDAVLEGSIRRHGQQLRVVAQLNRTDDGFHIWSQAYDLEFREAMRLEREIATAVAMRLRSGSGLETRYPFKPSPAGYDLYTRGRFLANDDSNRYIGEAIDQYQQAIAADPNYAAPHAGLADALVRLVTYGVLPPNQGMPQVRAASERAIALEPAHAQAHMLLGMVHNLFDWDWEAAEREYRTAIAISPAYAFVRYIYAYFLLAPRLRHQEATEQLECAQYLDPLSTHIQAARISLLGFQRKFAEAEELGRRVVQHDPNSFLAAIQFGWALQNVGKFDEAMEQYERARALGGAAGLVQSSIALCHIQRGNFTEALKMAQGDAFHMARLYAAMREGSRALTWLHQTREEHLVPIVFLDTLPHFDWLRGDAGYEAIRASVGLA